MLHMFEWLKSTSGSYNLTLIISIIAWLIAGIGIIAGFNHYKIKTKDANYRAKEAERMRVEMESELGLTKSELDYTKEKAKKINEELQAIKTPRKFTKGEMESIISKLKHKRKGKVIVTYLSVERDAEHYAKQLEEILSESGFESKLSNHLWLQLAFDGLYICSWEPDTVPFFATDLQQVLQESGLKVSGSYDSTFLTSLNVPKDGIALVVSNKIL
jgi:hypothetical protein